MKCSAHFSSLEWTHISKAIVAGFEIHSVKRNDVCIGLRGHPYGLSCTLLSPAIYVCYIYFYIHCGGFLDSFGSHNFCSVELAVWVRGHIRGCILASGSHTGRK